jgi:hypothetical protein
MVTRRGVIDMANQFQVQLTESEIEQVEEIVAKTGSWAPQDEVIRRFQDGLLTPGLLTFFVPWLWRYKADDCTVSNDVWHGMFGEAHFTDNCVGSKRPRRTVRAYRGATFENRHGLSWSLDKGQAEYFARSRQAPGAKARVWVANIPASRFYAQYLNELEKEVTADVRGLDVYPVEDAANLPRLHSWQWWR